VSSEVFVHPRALCESDCVGAGTRIWAFAHVLPGAVIGEDCNICDSVFIENDVIVGDRVTIKSGVQLWDGVRIADDVFVGPNATFTNDLYPRSKQTPLQFLTTEIHDGASVGANATLLPGITIGRRAIIGAGAVVTRDVPAHAKVVGNPARIAGYSDDVSVIATRTSSGTDLGQQALPRGVRLVDVPITEDLRGSLAAIEIGEVLPFVPRRYFLVFGVPSLRVRGEHAHRVCWQYLTCVTGSVSLHVDDGRSGYEVKLDSPGLGVVIPPLVWASQFNYSPDAMLFVLASHRYDPDDYIRDYGDFLATVSDPAPQARADE
jgi:acetyltransferase-like isoleucine patch superfamily enzyme